MTFDWLKEKAKDAVKAVEETGSKFVHEVHELGKSVFGDDKPEAKTSTPDLKTAEAKTESKAAAPKDGAKTAEAKSDGLIADAQAVVAAAKKAVASELGTSAVTNVFNTILDYASLPIRAATDPIGSAGKLAELAIGTGKMIGTSLGLLDTKDSNFKLALVADDANLSLAGLADKLREEAIAETAKKNDISEISTSGLNITPPCKKESLGTIALENIFEQCNKTDINSVADLKVVSHDGNVQSLKVPEAAIKWFAPEGSKPPLESEKKVEQASPAGTASRDKYSTEFQHAFTDANGERTETFALPGHVISKKFDQTGSLITSLDKTADRTVLSHKGETVRREGGKTFVEGEGYHIVRDEQTGKTTLRMETGLVITKDKDKAFAEITGTNMSVATQAGLTEINNVAGHSFNFVKDKDSARLEQMTKEIQANLKDGQSAALVGPGFNRFVFNNATLDVLKSENNVEWILKTAGKTFLFTKEDGKLVMKHDGSTTEVKDDKDTASFFQQLKDATNGNVAELKNGQLLMAHVTADINAGFTFVTNGQNEKATVQLTESGTQVKTATAPKDAASDTPGGDACKVAPGPAAANSMQDMLSALRDGILQAPPASDCNDRKKLTFFNYTTEGSLKISTPTDISAEQVADPAQLASLIQAGANNRSQNQTPQEEQHIVKTTPLMEVAIEKAEIKIPATDKNPEMIVSPEKIENVKTGTQITEKGDVRLGHDGPELFHDGSVRLDRNTYVSADMKVSSGGWESSAALMRGPISEAQAQSIAMTISGIANAAYTKALGSVVRWSEIADLNCALSDVLSMMSVIPAGSPAHALLMKSYGLIMQALAVASPKAQLAEKAASRGLNSTTAIEKFELGGWGAVKNERQAAGLR